MISFETVRNMKDVGIPPLQGRHKKGDKWRAKWGDLTQGSHGSGEWDRKNMEKRDNLPKVATRRSDKQMARHNSQSWGQCEVPRPVGQHKWRSTVSVETHWGQFWDQGSPPQGSQSEVGAPGNHKKEEWRAK